MIRNVIYHLNIENFTNKKHYTSLHQLIPNKKNNLSIKQNIFHGMEYYKCHQ